MNAKIELLQAIGGRMIRCALITSAPYWHEEGDPSYVKAVLKEGYGKEDIDSFLSVLNGVNYDSSYGSQELFGTVWFEDGTWMERGEYDGSEWWEIRKMPAIPEQCLDN